MAPMPETYLQVVWVILCFGLPYSLVLYPALALVPIFLIRTVAVRSRPSRLEAPERARSRKWLICTLVSLIPWFALGAWILFDAITNKSF